MDNRFYKPRPSRRFHRRCPRSGGCTARRAPPRSCRRAAPSVSLSPRSACSARALARAGAARGAGLRRGARAGCSRRGLGAAGAAIAARTGAAAAAARRRRARPADHRAGRRNSRPARPRDRGRGQCRVAPRRHRHPRRPAELRAGRRPGARHRQRAHQPATATSTAAPSCSCSVQSLRGLLRAADATSSRASAPAATPSASTSSTTQRAVAPAPPTRAAGPTAAARRPGCCRRDRVKLDLEANEGVAEGAVLRFYGVPILAAPVLSFPLTDARKSGWLPPSINLDSKSGLEVEVPYYWNIAPQPRRDLHAGDQHAPRPSASTPSSATSSRATAARSTYNLLPERPRRRPLAPCARLPPHGHVGERGRATRRTCCASPTTTTGRTSRATIASLTPRLLPADVQASRDWRRGGGDWTAYARLQQWQVLQDADPAARIEAPYERSPQLGARYLAALRRRLRVGARRRVQPLHAARPAISIRRAADRLRGCTRSAASAGRSSTPGWTFTPRLSFNAADYALDRPLADGAHDRVARHPDPEPGQRLGASSATRAGSAAALRQTLEPRLLYVNTPFRDQARLPNFDAARQRLQLRVDLHRERLLRHRPRLGRAPAHRRRDHPRCSTRTTGAEAAAPRRRAALPAARPAHHARAARRSASASPTCCCSARPAWCRVDAGRLAAVQPGDSTAPCARSSARATRPGRFARVNATYRFTRGLERAGRTRLAVADLPAAGAATRRWRGSPGAPACAGTWYSVGRVNYSMRDARLTDSIVGLEYDAGCWIGRVVAERLSTGRSEATTRLLLQLELVGLSRLGTQPAAGLEGQYPRLPAAARATAPLLPAITHL